MTQTQFEIRQALRRVGLTPTGSKAPGDWLAEDAPSWCWPDFSDYRLSIYDWRTE